jgi:hypothetical protein
MLDDAMYTMEMSPFPHATVPSKMLAYPHTVINLGSDFYVPLCQ